jgi:hypothetical protein
VLGVACGSGPAEGSRSGGATAEQTRTAGREAPKQSRYESLAGPPKPAEGVRELEVPCEPGLEERCNALDEDCNGRIDDACGWKSGVVQVTAAWNTHADVDLHVTDPSGKTLKPGQRQSPAGGHLDRDAGGKCSSDGNAELRVANAYWEGAEPASGRYEVAVRRADPCDAEGPTAVTVSVSVGGQVIGVFNRTLGSGAAQPVVAFEVK